MEVATTERHWNDTSVPERPELEVTVTSFFKKNSLLFENQFLLPVLISCSLFQSPGMASRRCALASYLLNDHLQHAGSVIYVEDITKKSLEEKNTEEM